jgi:mannose-6-phosphate isomerase
MQVRCCVKNYNWGGDGDCLVARLARGGGHVSEDPESAVFAELWLGTHPSGPSLAGSGPLPVEKVPYLLKVLSVRRALSIQIHPTQRRGAVLHEERPDLYPDPNHKPEVAVALTPFEALAGLRDGAELATTLAQFPELDPASTFLDVLVGDPEDTGRLVRSVVGRLTATPEEDRSELDSLTLELDQQHPGGDPGVLAPLFLRWVKLEKGDALFTPPGCPHAYLRGDIVECTAAWDNVVRLALTTKARDLSAAARVLNPAALPRIFSHRHGATFTVQSEFWVTVRAAEPSLTTGPASFLIDLDKGLAYFTPSPVPVCRLVGEGTLVACAGPTDERAVDCLQTE